MDEAESIDNGSTFDNQDTSKKFKLSNKLLLESIKYAFVYTTRIDDMKVTKHQNNPELLMEILQQSKPIYNEKKAKNVIFEKPLNMRYDLKKLQSNPDFNWKKKRDSIGYKNLRCLSDARRLCKPVTIDLCKKFEKFLDNNGTIKLHLLEQNIGPYNEQKYYKHDLSDYSETISAYSDHSDIEKVNPLGIQIVDTCSLSTEHKKEEPIMNINFSPCRNSAPHRAILVMIDEKLNAQKMFDVQIESCHEVKSNYKTVSSHINIKYCCHCKRNLILQNLVKNQVLVPVTTLKYFRPNVLCSTNTCDCCCKLAVHTDVICYVDKKNDAVTKSGESAVVQSMKKIDSELLSKYQYRYVHKYIERGVQETEEIYVIFSYKKKYSNKYNPKHKYEVYHIDKLSRIKSHLTCIIPPVLRSDSTRYMFDLCCWFKRIKIVYSLEISLGKSLTYLRSMHSCTINYCNCCCSALYNTIPLHKDWDVRNCPLPARSISSDIDIHRARSKSSREYDNICIKGNTEQTCSTLNLQANSGIAESINSTKNVQEVPQKTAELINIPESDTTSVAKNNINPGPGFDIENSLPAFVLATQTKSADLPPSLENNDNNMNYDALSIFKQARLRLTPDGRITAVFSNLEQKLNQDQLIGMCKILNIAQKHVHLIDFSTENAMDELIKITLSQYNEGNDSASVPIITDVFSLAEPAPKSNNLKVYAQDEPPPKNVTQPPVSQPKTDHIPQNVIQPILYRAIVGQPKIYQSNAGNTLQPNVGQANIFIPITIQGQTKYIQQSNIQSNIIKGNNIPSNVGSIILPDNMILLPNFVVAPNYNTNVVNTVSDNRSVRHESHQGAKRQAVPLPAIVNSVKRFASEKILSPFPFGHSVNVHGQQENFQNEMELEDESESILGL